MTFNQTIAGSPAFSNEPYPISIVVATLSLTTMLLILPPMFWHFRNRNIGATSFVFWLAISLFFNFLNAVLWSNDDFDSWFHGAGLCDIETKIQMASQVALPASFACTLRALAVVLDTDRVILVQTSKQRRRKCAVELLCCFGLPMLQMLFQFIVQSGRFYVFGISGCAPMVVDNWLTIMLLYVPPTLWECVDTYFAIIILIRLYRYHLTFNNILTSSNTTKSRFLRLYLICVFWLLCAIPSSIYTFVEAYGTVHQNENIWRSFDWNEVHRNTWSLVVFERSYGRTGTTSWVPLASGLGVFIFFGFGKDAIAMYKAGFAAVGLSRWFDRPTPADDTSRAISLLGDKAKLIYKRISISTWSSRSSNAPLSLSSKSSADIECSVYNMRDAKDLGRTMYITNKSSSPAVLWDATSHTKQTHDCDVDIALVELGEGTRTVHTNPAADA